MLKSLRKSEEGFKDGSKIAFLLQVIEVKSVYTYNYLPFIEQCKTENVT